MLYIILLIPSWSAIVPSKRRTYADTKHSRSTERRRCPAHGRASGSELQRRGVEVLIEATGDALGAWSANANLDAPEVVLQIHQDYMRCGAEVNITNNFWTSRSRLSRFGLGDRWEEYARAAAEHAVKARDNLNPEAYVLAGMAPPYVQTPYGTEGDNYDSDVTQLGRDYVYEDYRDQARVVADAGVDAMLPEFVSYIDDAEAAVAGCAETGLPVFLGLRSIREDGMMEYGESYEDLVSALSGTRVDGILLMCSRPEHISAGLPKLRQAFDGPIGAYPNVGYNPRGPLKESGSDFVWEHPYTPSRMAGFTMEWRDMDAQIIGGCCATGPEHTLSMRDALQAA